MSLKRARDHEEEQHAKKPRVGEEEEDPWVGLLPEVWLMIVESAPWPDPMRRGLECPMARLMGCLSRRFFELVAPLLALRPDWPMGYAVLHWQEWYGAFRPVRVLYSASEFEKPPKFHFDFYGKDGKLFGVDPIFVAAGALWGRSAENIHLTQRGIPPTKLPGEHPFTRDGRLRRQLTLAFNVFAVAFNGMDGDQFNTPAGDTLKDHVTGVFRQACSMETVDRTVSLCGFISSYGHTWFLHRAIRSGRADVVRYLLCDLPDRPKCPWYVAEAGQRLGIAPMTFRDTVLEAVLEGRIYDADLLATLLYPAEMHEMRPAWSFAAWNHVFEYASAMDATAPDSLRLVTWWLPRLSEELRSLFILALLLRSRRHAALIRGVLASQGGEPRVLDFSVLREWPEPLLKFLTIARCDSAIAAGAPYISDVVVKVREGVQVFQIRSLPFALLPDTDSLGWSLD